MEWWMWLAAGLVLVVAELATPGGFVIIFFGIAALVVGILGLLGVVTSASLQFLLFSVLAVGLLAILRARLKSRNCARRTSRPFPSPSARRRRPILSCVPNNSPVRSA